MAKTALPTTLSNAVVAACDHPASLGVARRSAKLAGTIITAPAIVI